VCGVRVFYSKILTFVTALSIQPAFLSLSRASSLHYCCNDRESRDHSPIMIHRCRNDFAQVHACSCTNRLVPLKRYVVKWVLSLVRYHVYIRTLYNSCITVLWSRLPASRGHSSHASTFTNSILPLLGQYSDLKIMGYLQLDLSHDRVS
jgi:hypothetical protein